MIFISTDDKVRALIESEISTKPFRQNWARLLQKNLSAAGGPEAFIIYDHSSAPIEDDPPSTFSAR